MVTVCPPRAFVRPGFVLAGLLGGLASTALGLASSDVIVQIAWERAFELAAWMAAFALLCYLVSATSKRPPRLIALYLLVLLVPLLHGLAATAVVALFALVAASLGDRMGVPARRRPALACVVGLALIAAAAGWTQGLAIHRQWLLCLALLSLIWLLRNNLHEVLLGCRITWRRLSSPQSPGFWPLLLVALALLASAHPTLQFDDLAYHAALPAQLLEFGENRLDAHSQIWALAPWAADVLQGWAAVLAGFEVRGAMNALWWLLLWLGVTELLRATGWGAHSARWAIALGASLPLSWLLLAGMQTELAGAVVLIALVGWLARADSDDIGKRARVLGLLVGLLIGLKLTNLLYVGMLAAAALVWAPRGMLQQLPRALPWAALAGGSSFAYAAWISGNPVLPLYNSWFGSDYVAAADLADLRYRHGLDFGDYYDALFDTSLVLEGWDGTAGFQWSLLLVTLVIGLAALWTRRNRLPSVPTTLLPLRYAIVAILLAGLLLYSQMQYLRYLYPAMLLAGVAMGLGAERSGLRGHKSVLIAMALPICLALCVAANLVGVGNVSWQLREGLTPRVLIDPQAEQHWRDFAAPELRLVAIARAMQPEANILLADPVYPYIASGLGRSFTSAWYDPELWAMRGRCNADSSGRCWREQLNLHGFALLVSRDRGRAPALSVALSGWATLVERNADAELYRIPLDPHTAGDIYHERKQ